MELAGRVALVTGAGSGIGKAASLRLAREGAVIGVLSRTAVEVQATADAIEAAGGKALPLVADVRDARAMEVQVDRLARACNRLDIVFANAGINGVWAAIDDLTPEEWDHTIATNLTGTFLTLRAAVPHLKRTGAGAVVIDASINGTRVFSNAGATAYSCSKAALLAMTQTLALELARNRIRVNAVCPGRIATDIQDNTWPRDLDRIREPGEFPDGRIPLTGDRAGTPEDVAELVAFLVSDRARHITGTPVWIDGGQSLSMG
jgi:NAD(P)-dependent dehydrogenase (short-subunit alcohol dehydrogenase family)